MASLQCQFCGAPVTIGEPIPRESECESCRHDLRCCRNCRHFDARYNNACTEPMADPVEEKDRRNFCEYFYFNRAPFAPAAPTAAREDEARRKLGALFGGPSGPESKPGAGTRLDPLFGRAAKDREGDARRKLDDLFRKPPAGDADDG